MADGDAVDVVAQLKEESEVPLRSHGSLSMNRALMAAGLVDRVQVTFFPVITGQNGSDAIFEGAADFDLELLESRTLDGNIRGAHVPAHPACPFVSTHPRAANTARTLPRGDGAATWRPASPRSPPVSNW